MLAREPVATTVLRASAGTFPLKPPLTSDQRRLIFGRDAKGNGTLFSVDDGQVEHGQSAEYSLYDVNYWSGAVAKPWLPWCRPDREGVAKAIPLQGAWDATGAFVDDDSQITFACTSGVLAKCVRWGYPPWATSLGRSLKALHQACTRMARADYCGTGKPHTREGTPIWFSDLENLNRAQASPTAGAFEASWGPDGAVCVRRARWYETLAELVMECPEKLAGRVGMSCHPAFDGGVLVNSSLIQPPEP